MVVIKGTCSSRRVCPMTPACPWRPLPLLERHRDHTEVPLREVSHPGSYDSPRLRAIESATRRAHSDTVAGATRLALEPPHRPLTPELAQNLTAAAAPAA
jgi:hypothetical protein